jgi:thiol-disulfide isomerase/thioredoxin
VNKPTRFARGRIGVATLLLLSTLLSCSEDHNTVGAAAKLDSDRLGLRSGTVEFTPTERRSTSIRLQGKILEGTPLDTADYLGKIVVINVWGSWCAGCVTEAPDLEKAWLARKSRGVVFVGVAIRESAVTSLAFQRKYNISYPSLAWDGGRTMLQLKGKVSAPPTTIILDRQGRLAARVLSVTNAATLTGLIDDVDRSRVQQPG